MAVNETDVVLYRIGRSPDPLAGPSPGSPKNSGNRFDDPEGRVWVLYAAEQRRACFAETLARFRPDVALLAQLRDLPEGDDGDDTPAYGVVPDDWHLKRLMATFRVVAGQRWLDLREMETRELIRRELAETLSSLGRDDFDLSDALSRDRKLTQAIAAWAYDKGFHGIIYKSRLDAAFDCWAIFEGAQIEPLVIESIARDDPDLHAVAQSLGLQLLA